MLADLQLSASSVPHNIFLLSIAPLINAQLLVGVLMETPLPLLDSWRQDMRHSVEVSRYASLQQIAAWTAVLHISQCQSMDGAHCCMAVSSACARC